MPTTSLAASVVTAIVAVAAIVSSSPGVRTGPTRAAWTVGVWLAAATWIVSTVAWAVAARRPPVARALAPSVSGPLSAAGPAVLFVLAMPAVDHPLALGWLWIWSFALGADAVLQSVAVGQVGMVAWLRDGVLMAAVVGLSLALGRVDIGRTLLLAVGALALAWLVAVAIHAAVRRHQRALDVERAAVEAAERRRRANWIHDELLSELRLARLRLETSEGGTRQALSELSDIEHRLRLRQLDVELEAGGARLAEIIQPFVRMVTAVGCRVEGVPAAEVADTWLDAGAGYELKRFFGVAVPNALLAGATLVVFDVVVDGRRMVVQVRDNAGGFDPEGAPAGRGRDRLARELGDGRLSTTVDAVGTTFTCEFELDLDVPGA